MIFLFFLILIVISIERKGILEKLFESSEHQQKDFVKVECENGVGNIENILTSNNSFWYSGSKPYFTLAFYKIMDSIFLL